MLGNHLFFTLIKLFDKIISVVFMFTRMVIYFKRLNIIHLPMIKLKKTEEETC